MDKITPYMEASRYICIFKTTLSGVEEGKFFFKKITFFFFALNDPLQNHGIASNDSCMCGKT